MATYNTLSPEQMERIVMLSTHFNSSETATILNLSESSIRKVCLAHETAKAGDIERMRTIQVSEPVRAWAAAKFNLDLTVKQEQPKEEQPEAPRPVDNTAEAFTKVMAALMELHKDLSRVCGAIINLTEEIKGEHAETVKIINLNSDNLYGLVKEQKDVLNGIKMNTRRKGNNDPA